MFQFFKFFSQNVIKWWHVHVVSVFKLNNNPEKETAPEGESTPEQAGTEGVESAPEEGTGGMQHFGSNEAPAGTDADAMEVLNRINREKKEKEMAEIEALRKKREEEDRIASIMRSNKVDVNAFIEEGKNSIPAPAPAPAASADDEAARRAQEIIDRLNREAAEDEAKKQAEIDAAKAAAREAGLS